MATKANYRAIYSTTKENASSRRCTKATSASEAAKILGVYAEWIAFQVTIQVSDGKKWTNASK